MVDAGFAQNQFPGTHVEMKMLSPGRRQVICLEITHNRLVTTLENQVAIYDPEDGLMIWVAQTVGSWSAVEPQKASAQVPFIHPHILRWEWMEPLYTPKGASVP